MNIIMNDLIELMDPRYIEVWGKFTPRGGISIDPYTNYGKPGTKYEKMAEYRMMKMTCIRRRLIIGNGTRCPNLDVCNSTSIFCFLKHLLSYLFYIPRLCKKDERIRGEFHSPLSNEKTGCWMAARLFYYNLTNVCL
ncbi:7-cyano-7-deazaguanine reductase [Bacillus subtilis]|nr:7-cyano-7-deazaguanine reductase [Bacillus subtilis]